MTKMKVQKSIAIILAMCMAFVLLAVSMQTTSVFAAQPTNGVASEKDGVTYVLESPDLTKDEEQEHYYVADDSKYEYAPEVSFVANFTNRDGQYNSPQSSPRIRLALSFYSDKELKNEVKPTYLLSASGIGTMGDTLNFAVKLEDATGFEEGKTYWMVIGKDLTKSKSFDGVDITIEFKVNKVKETPTSSEEPSTKETPSSSSSTSSTTSSTTSTTKSTTTTTKKNASSKTIYTRTTARTVTTRNTARTVTTRRTATTVKRATAANTGDNSNMPFWIGLAIVSAGGLSLAYVWRKPE